MSYVKQEYQEYIDIISQFSKKNILVFGDMGVDRYTVGVVERISPEAPVPIVLVTHEWDKLGLSANVADNITAVGAKSSVVGLVGNDFTAKEFVELLETSRIKASGLVKDSSRRTVLKERIETDRQQLMRVDYENLAALTPAIEAKLLAQFKTALKTADCVIIQDYAKGTLTEKLIQAAIKETKRAKKWLLIDPHSSRPIHWYEGGTVFKPNLKEAERLSGVSIVDDESLCVAGQNLLKFSKSDWVVITRGKDGMAIFSKKSKKVDLIPTFAREVFDVSGAGDTVVAIMALSLVSGATLIQASVLANMAAGVVVAKRGTATVKIDEILQQIDLFSQA